MSAIVIAIASDHAGYALKSEIIRTFSGRFRFVDFGADNAVTRIDYPDQAYRVARYMGEDTQVRFGILACGSGIGMSIAANRHGHIRAALCHNATTAQLARQHNDANILCLGERVIGVDKGIECVDAFVRATFEEGRHAARVRRLDNV